MAKFNVDALKVEKEAEIQELVSQLDVFKGEIDTSNAKVAQLNQKKQQHEEE